MRHCAIKRGDCGAPFSSTRSHPLLPFPPSLSLSLPLSSSSLPPAQALPTYWAHGFNPFHSEYEAANVLKGKRVRFNRGGSSSEGEAADEVVGTVTGVGEDGRLYIWVENPLGTPADVPRGDAGAYVGAPGAEAGGLVDGGATGASAGPGTLLSFLSGEVRGLEVVA